MMMMMMMRLRRDLRRLRPCDCSSRPHITTPHLHSCFHSPHMCLSSNPPCCKWLAVVKQPKHSTTQHNTGTQSTTNTGTKNQQNTKLVQHFSFVKDEEESKKERQSRNTEMSKNVGSIHVHVLGFTHQGLGLKNQGKLQLEMDHSSKQPPPPHTQTNWETERESKQHGEVEWKVSATASWKLRSEH